MQIPRMRENLRLTVLLGLSERRWLIEEAARRSIERCAPISLSGLMRDIVAEKARQTGGDEPRRAA